MAKTPIRPTRSIKKSPHQDLGKSMAEKYNEAAGADKVMIVHPSYIRSTLIDEVVGAGKLIKITAAGTYSLKLLGKGHDAGKVYNIGDIVEQGGNVYMAGKDKLSGAFDAADWQKVASAVVAGIPNAAGDIVSTGRWHNAISAAGHLVDDDTHISHAQQRR